MNNLAVVLLYAAKLDEVRFFSFYSQNCRSHVANANLTLFSGDRTPSSLTRIRPLSRLFKRNHPFQLIDSA